jgi:hypothetical protein
VVAIQSLALLSLDLVLIDHYAYAAPAPILEAAHYAASAIDLHIAPGAHHIGGQ